MAKTKSDRGRLNLRLPPGMKKWAFDYARRNNTKVTQIIVDHLTKLQRKDKGHE